MYFPYQKGRYEVAPGLLPLGKDLGNGSWDQKIFQVGADAQVFRDQFETNRKLEPISKYVCLAKNADPVAVAQISRWIAEQIVAEYPSGAAVFHADAAETYFHHFAAQNNSLEEKIRFNDRNAILEQTPDFFHYENAWDAMGSQVPEDLAIWKLNDDGSEELEALHLNAPNHWAAEEKIGKSFAAVHQPVAHIEKIVPYAVNILRGIIDKGPLVRFAWGVSTDARLNHHPEPPEDFSPESWQGRRFNPAAPELWVRVERQALFGFPALNRALFTIRTYFQEVKELKKTNPEAVLGLIAAIESMSPESLIYKGLVQDKEPILTWLRLAE